MTQISSPRKMHWIAGPLLVLAALYLALSLRSAWQRATTPWPFTPWESAITTDAWRINHQQRVYENPANGHATHMYGPLVTLTAAALERAFGPDVRAPRAASLVAAILLALLAGATCARGRAAWVAVLIAAMVYLQFYRTKEWSTEARPDAESMLFAFAAMLLFYRSAAAARRASMIALSVGGTALLLIGFFFKQPALAICLAPPIAAIVERRRESLIPFRDRFLVSLIAPASALAMVGLMRVSTPWLYFYMIRVPASYSIVWTDFVASLLDLGRFNLLFIFAAGAFVALRAACGRVKPLERFDRWLLIVMPLTMIFGAAANAKIGGWTNSLLPAFVAMAIFSVRALDDLWAMLATEPRLPAAKLATAFVPPLLLLSDLSAILHVFTPGTSPWLYRQGDRNYARVIREASQLPGKVVSPDDPTVALRAKGYSGRCADCERDAHGGTLPGYVDDELRDAEWFIQVKSSRGSNFTDATLTRLGFVPAHWRTPANAEYALWRHKTGTTNAATTDSATQSLNPRFPAPP